jgi:hypothetical protein
MADILNKIGAVDAGDVKDSWEMTLEAGKTYHFKAENLDDHGRYNLVIESEYLNYGEIPIADDWNRLVKSTVEPTITNSGTFDAPRSVYGLNVADPAEQEEINSRSYIRVKVKWIFTIYNANYHVRIYE